jgi:hypothetical protein
MPGKTEDNFAEVEHMNSDQLKGNWKQFASPIKPGGRGIIALR